MKKTIAFVLRCTQRCTKIHSCASGGGKKKKKEGKKAFIIQTMDAVGTRQMLCRAEDAAGQHRRQPAVSQRSLTDCVGDIFTQLSQTHGASTQGNTAPAPQQS